jgi:hypothetical protein
MEKAPDDAQSMQGQATMKEINFSFCFNNKQQYYMILVMQKRGLTPF